MMRDEWLKVKEEETAMKLLKYGRIKVCGLLLAGIFVCGRVAAAPATAYWSGAVEYRNASLSAAINAFQFSTSPFRGSLLIFR